MLWTKFIQPYIIHLACSSNILKQQRKRILSLAEGHVLEIGFGSGLNLPHYNENKIIELIALEPSHEMQKIAKKTLKPNFPVNFLTSFAESIPMKDESVDTVVCTYTLCSIYNPIQVLLEIKRVLKKNGKFLILEHVKSPDSNVSFIQNKLNPFWKIIAGGCHLNCNTKRYLKEVGFDISNLNEMYLPKIPKFIGYNIIGLLKNT